ncbi:4-(cytidine 5'-diphospho)-2-C-methyl-D-erythritol kinase [Campylobacter sp. RM9333]|uniref:4-(cytidine 5'-diphospho)-2-C-methyl-D-erythritol kinase n=1 Tax=Campylobacter sp. RM9333 TaxID=2735731 RepID=UPI001D67F63B|nr:4-(cytidine 5'-diphospho)-2-C-methyl-D-erythritol kinase [Campylobacter sp. RM9333]
MKAFAKINIFLKITGKKDNYHQLISRFYRIDNLYDELYFIPKNEARNLDKTLIPNSNSLLKINGITYENEFKQDVLMDKFYLINDNLVSNFYSKSDIFSKVLSLIDENLKQEFQNNFALVLHKNIPTFAGLGGASSNAACFIKLLNDIKPFDTKAIARLSGADVSFFESGLKSANVSGYGEIIDDFSDDLCDFSLEFSTPCSTKDVFSEFAKEPKYYENDELSKLKTKELLNNFTNYELNDLLKPCNALYSITLDYANKGLFLSGSGGSFFKLKS